MTASPIYECRVEVYTLARVGNRGGAFLLLVIAIDHSDVVQTQAREERRGLGLGDEHRDGLEPFLGRVEAHLDPVEMRIDGHRTSGTVETKNIPDEDTRYNHYEVDKKETFKCRLRTLAPR